MTIGRLAMGSALGIAGILATILSIFGAAINYEEWQSHFCGGPQSEPVCGAIVWSIAEFILLATGGIALAVLGAYLASPSSRNKPSE